LPTVLTPSGDQSGATDTAAINAALDPNVASTAVLLAAGHWFTNAPIVVGSGHLLAGEGGAVNGVTSMNPEGTVIHPIARFAGGEVVTLPDRIRGARLRDWSIINDLGTGPHVDGIVARGEVDGTLLSDLAVALVTGHGVAWVQSNGRDGDGCWIFRVMVQRPGLNGFHRIPNDANVENVHIQYAGEAGDPGNRHGFFTTPGSTGNATFVGCRADLCRGSGWVLDHKGVYGDAVKLIGCSTERNSQSGVLVLNSSPGGDDWRTPVIVSGCGIGGDGTGTGPGGHPSGPGGEFAGIEVRGKNRVFIDATTVTVNKVDNKQGAPRYALILRRAGTNQAQPETVAWSSGRMNFSTQQGGAGPILNHSLCDNLLIGPTVTYTGDYEDQTPTCRTGSATLGSGAAPTTTVTTKWAWPSMLVQVTPRGFAAGRIYADSFADGSFKIKSSSSSDAGLDVAWVITPGD
jgi:hypothetical protein